MHQHSWFNSNIVSSWRVIWLCITVLIGWGILLSSNCWGGRMMAVIIVITQPLFLPNVWVTQTNTLRLCALVWKISLIPWAPFPSVDLGNVTYHQSFVRGQSGPLLYVTHPCGSTCFYTFSDPHPVSCFSWKHSFNPKLSHQDNSRPTADVQ